jgi:hypothetical protein
MLGQHIRLAGEQGEVFDQQMDTDRDWFESHRGVLYFRPQIPGEWNEQLALGIAIPTAGPLGPDGSLDFLPDQAVWTAVVDLGRFLRIAVDRAPAAPATGFRTRLRVVPPLTHAARRDMAVAVIAYVRCTLQALQEQARKQHRCSSNKPQGFRHG